MLLERTGGPQALEELDARADAMLLRATEESVEGALNRLWEARALWTGLGGVYPEWRQPLGRVRARLMEGLLAARSWEEAFCVGVEGFVRERDGAGAEREGEAWSAGRVVRAWVLARLGLQIAALGGGRLGSWGLDWRIVVGGLLEELWRRVEASHGLDSRFGAMVVRAVEDFGGAAAARVGAGLVPRADREREWGKLAAVAESGLDWLQGKRGGKPGWAS
jgi:hypothetical protein